jgi:hypothetical protein
MARINEATMAQCLTTELAETMRAALRTYRDANGDIRWPMNGKVGDITIKRDVVATLHERSAGPERVTYDITFTPAAGGPFPTFTGTLTAARQAIAECRLTVSGNYRPPFCILGAIFDALIGRHMANRSIRAFLTTLRHEVETAALFAPGAD